MGPDSKEKIGTCRVLLARHILRLLGGYQLALGGWFIALRPPLLPEDLRYVGQASSRLRPWLDLVFNVMGGDHGVGNRYIARHLIRYNKQPSVEYAYPESRNFAAFSCRDQPSTGTNASVAG